jgi:type II secretory ATPase GspE/PulE/Tfp pilus assembly ATPase PilB-like protein
MQHLAELSYYLWSQIVALAYSLKQIHIMPLANRSFLRIRYHDKLISVSSMLKEFLNPFISDFNKS